MFTPVEIFFVDTGEGNVCETDLLIGFVYLFEQLFRQFPGSGSFSHTSVYIQYGLFHITPANGNQLTILTSVFRTFF